MRERQYNRLRKKECLLPNLVGEFLEGINSRAEMRGSGVESFVNEGVRRVSDWSATRR